MAESLTQAAVLQVLRSIQDPDLHRDIVSLGFVKDVTTTDGKVAVTIELTTPACPVRDKMKDDARRLIGSLPGVKEVEISMTSKVRSTVTQKLLPGVKNVVPVASGKGGVGKSTVSANLALALARMGARVGLLDADVYGPSIPLIMGVTEPPRTVGERLVPAEQYGVKVMSTGFFVPEGQAVIWRGPMLSKMIEQFLGGVEWGELDYLVVDLPPGTGDVQLTLCQKIPLTGAAVVTTPQDVAVRVAEKAIIMFDKLNCPVLGIIENMSRYVCRHCGGSDEIFGSGGGRQAAKRFGLSFLGEIPLATGIRVAADEGHPTVISDPDSSQARAFFQVAENLAAQISIRGVKGELGQEIRISF